MSAEYILYYDGECGFCDSTVQFVLRHDRSKTLRFAPLQGAHASELLSRHRWLATVDSLVWVEPHAGGASRERVLVRSDAVMRIGRYLGLPWSLAALGRVIPKVLRDRAYDVFARHRKRILAMPTSCELPLPEVRARFLD